MGHVLRRVTREDSFDEQPLRSSNGTAVLAADIRLDNREDLAALLSISDGALAELPDSALLLQAYTKWGESCVDRLIGDFAFAIWDSHENALFLARDHMGQRHLFTHAAKDFFAFASDAKGLWALPRISQALDLTTLGRRLAGDRSPYDGASFFEGIHGLEGGTIARVTAAGEIAVRRYWSPSADPQHLNRDEAYYVKAYREVLAEAVACRVRRARQAPALLLGGGFDTGAIAGLAGPALGGKKLLCLLSVETADGPARGARRWAQILARDMAHIDLRCVPREGADVFTNMEAGFLETGEPHSPNRFASDLLCATAAKAGARMIMDGYGGDYTLNPRGNGWLVRRLLRGQLACFIAEFRAHCAHTGTSPMQAAKREILAQLLPAKAMQGWWRWRAGLPLFGTAAPITLALLKAARLSGRKLDRGIAVRRRELAPQMAKILRRQQAAHVKGGALLAASHGMEFSQPFHDKRVVELALAIPEMLHVRNGRDRYLARVALSDLYPPEYQTRGSANDDLITDFPAMAERAKPRLLSEIARMQQNARLSAMFDFPRMSRMLSGADGRRLDNRNEAAARHAIRTFLHARFVEWFQRDNQQDAGPR
jgi:asparagine synthase (glutamine-hydrolysing)